MRRQRRAAIAVAVIPLLALGLAGCGSKEDGKDAGGGSGGKAAGSQAEELDRARQFARCMRENGVDMADPEVGKDGAIMFNMSGGRGKKGADEKTSKAAMNKCRKYMPNGGKPPKLSPQDQEKMRLYAKCLREHGVKIDDPSGDGQLSIRLEKADGLSKEEFEAAQKACQKYQPGAKN
jgi:hypothetical protein